MNITTLKCELDRHGRLLDRLPRKPIAGLILMVLGPLSVGAHAASGATSSSLPADYVDFNSSFGGIGSGRVDISRFNRSNPVVPGTYRVDLYANDELVSREDVTFADMAGHNGATPCFSHRLIEKMGVDMDKLDPQVFGPGSGCIDLPAAIPDASAHFDPGSLRLDVSIPQVAMNRRARGYVSPELWETGETAATIKYNFSAYQANQSHSSNQSGAFLGLNTGLNIGGWRLRNYTTMNWANGTGAEWKNIGAYAQHDVVSLRSQLTVGDSFTSGELFTSTGFRGASLASDDRMLPDSIVGYAPTVRGVAETRARVEIRQNDYLIYETTVAPGSFEINDLYATGYGGDLQVSIVEADGRVRTFSVPYAAVPRLLRPGVSRYAVTAGELRNNTWFGKQPNFMEMTYQRGLNNWLTGYAGLQATDGNLYRSAVVGAAINTEAGAFSLDLTGSSAKLDIRDESRSGYSARASYSKSIPSIDTDFALAAYRYSSPGYLELSDAAMLQGMAHSAAQSDWTVTSANYRARDRFQFTLNQRLGARGGSLYAAASYYSYWDGQSDNTTYQLGYNNRFKDVSYSLTASRTLGANGRNDTQYFLSFSVPLGKSASSRPVLFNSTVASGSQQGTSLRAGVSGTAGEYNQFNYNLNASDASKQATTVDASGGWLTPYAELGAAYAWSENGRQASVNASGGVVLHSGGVTLAPRLSETIGIIQAKGASGALVANGMQGKVDGNGYAVVSDLMPYRMNDVSLDPSGTSTDVELQTTRQQVAPRAGAVVPLKFDTVTGRAVLIKASQPDGTQLPFGAEVLDAQGTPIGIVGQGGLIFARSVDDSGELAVRWGSEGKQQCKISYRLPPAAAGNATSYHNLQEICR